MVRPAQFLGPLQGDQPTLPALASCTLRVPAQPYALALVSDLRNSLAVHFLDHGRLFAADDSSTSPYAANALLPMSDLFKHQEATPDNIPSGHRALVLEAMRQPGVYLLLEDTTELSWSGKHAIAGFGPIGNSAAGLQGFFLHTVLSVRWPDTPQDHHKRQPVEVIGLSDQQYYVRTPCRRPRESS